MVKYDSIRSELDDWLYKIRNFMRLANEEMPIMREDFAIAVTKSDKAERYMMISMMKLFKLKQKREVFKAFKMNRDR